jgi:hypothetical protein
MVFTMLRTLRAACVAFVAVVFLFGTSTAFSPNQSKP